jgi:uncharacterized protein (TIGR02145 family)
MTMKKLNWFSTLTILAMVIVFANSCKKDKEDDSTNPTPNTTVTVTDIDGNVYHTITIGTQVWMVENLKTTHYRDGSAIPNVTDASWGSLTTGAYRDYNNSVTNSTTYGRLYNWHAVNDSRKLAPAGWHIPTDAEITVLTTNAGGVSVAGTNLKASASNTPAWDGSNSSGFTALPAGYTLGSYNSMGSLAYFWSATACSSTSAWYLGLGTGYATTFHLNDVKTGGFSVRCIKD